MELTPDIGQGRYHIRGYAVGAVHINSQQISHSVIVTPNILIDPWPPQSLAELNDSHFLPLLELHPAVILLGTGRCLSFPDPKHLFVLHNKKIGIEIMDTAAACRTYVLLMAEGRSVAAALLIN